MLRRENTFKRSTHNSTIYVFLLLAPTCNRQNTDCRIVHLLVLTRVLMDGMKNMSCMGLLWLRQWSSQILKRRVTHSNSAGKDFYSVRHDVLTQVVMKITPCRLVRGYGRFSGAWCLNLGLLALNMKVNWPVDRAKRPTWLESSPTRMWEFHNRPETSTRNYQSALRGVPKQRRSHLHCVRSLKSCNCGSVMLSAINVPRNCTAWGWQSVFFVVLL